jgi:hypothetical protein
MLVIKKSGFYNFICFLGDKPGVVRIESQTKLKKFLKNRGVGHLVAYGGLLAQVLWLFSKFSKFHYIQNPFEVNLGLKSDMIINGVITIQYPQLVIGYNNPIQIGARLSQPHL